MSTNDVYFTCPECGHTIVAEMALAGQLLECPDCGKDVQMPPVRDGRDPRWRHGKTTRRGGFAPPSRDVAGLVRKADLAQKELVYLERRQSLQVGKMDHLRNSLSLFTDQLGEVERWLERHPHSAVENIPAPVEWDPATEADPRPPVESFTHAPWRRVAIAASVAGIVACLAVVFYWMAPS